MGKKPELKHAKMRLNGPVSPQVLLIFRVYFSPDDPLLYPLFPKSRFFSNFHTISGSGRARVLDHWDGAGLKAAAAGPQPPGGHLAQCGRVQYEVLLVWNWFGIPI